MSAARGDRDLTAGQTVVSIGAIGAGISLGIILMTSATGPLRLVLGAVTLAGALVWLVMYLTAPSRARRRRDRAALEAVRLTTLPLRGDAVIAPVSGEAGRNAYSAALTRAGQPPSSAAPAVVWRADTNELEMNWGIGWEPVPAIVRATPEAGDPE